VPRKPRDLIEGGIYHVYARGNDRQVIFRDQADFRLYLALLGREVRRCGWRCLAYCLMDNHVHLLIETPQANLCEGMQRLQSEYAQTHNERHDRCGHVFQGRYGAELVKSDEQLWWLAAYIALNPVKAGICSAPEDWPWSSHRATLGAHAPAWLDVDRLLSYFSMFGGDPLRRYTELTQGVRPLESR
jgi:putative transposase